MTSRPTKWRGYTLRALTGRRHGVSGRASAAVPLVLAFLWAGGCRVGSTPGGTVSTGAGSVAPGIDLERAKAPLSRIEPVPRKPVRPETLAPLSPRARQQIPKARKLIDQQRYTEAAIELERALRYDPQHPEIHRTLASLHWEAGNLERARNHAAKALEFNPDDAVSHYILGRYLARRGDHVGAIHALRTAALCSDFVTGSEVAALGLYHLAVALEADGYLEAALQQYVQHQNAVARLDRPITDAELSGLADTGQRKVFEAVACLHEAMGRYHEAAAALEPLLAEPVADVSVSLRRARLLLRARRFSEAAAAAKAIPSGGEEVLTLLAEIYRSQGKPQLIVDDLRARLTERPDDERALLHLADALSEFGRQEEARKTLDDHLVRHPKAVLVRRALVESLARSGDWLEAYRVSVDGIALHPEEERALADALAQVASAEASDEPLTALDIATADAVSAYLVARAAQAMGRADAAHAWLRKAYELDAGFLPARTALARSLLDNYRYEEALAVAQRPEDGPPEHLELELVLGAIHERLDHAEAAERHFKAAMQLDRADARALFALAELFQSSGEHLRTQHQLRALLEIDPEHGPAREMLAYTYLREGKRDVAIEEFNELRKRTTDPAIQARCAGLLDHLFVKEPDLERYREVLRESMEKHGPEAETWIAIAQSYDMERDAQERAAAYRNALLVDPRNENAVLGLIEVSFRRLEFEQAAQRMESLVRRRPNRYEWRFALRGGPPGQLDLYWIIQDYDAALGVLDELDERGDVSEAWRQRFRDARLLTLRLAGRDDELMKLLATWAEGNENPALFRGILAREHLRREEFTESAALLETERQENPGNDQTLRLLAFALAGSGQNRRAEQLVLDRLAVDPDNDQTVITLANVLLERERFDDAVELLRSRLIDTLDRDMIQNQLIGVFVDAERYEACFEFIESLMDQVETILGAVERIHARRPIQPLSPDDPGLLPTEPFTPERLQRRLTILRLQLASVLIRAGDFRTARERLEEWLEHSTDKPSRFDYLARLVMCHRGEGNEAEAMEMLAGMHALGPENPGINNDLAYGWIDQGVHLDKAEPMIRFAVWKSPRNAAYLDTYGWLLYKKGDFDGAMKWLTRAKVANQDSDPVIHDHLGDTAWRLSRKEEAIAHWRRAVEISNTRSENARISADERRARAEAPAKIEAAEAGRPPGIAALAAVPDAPDLNEER